MWAGGRNMRNVFETPMSEKEREKVLQVLGQRFPCSSLGRVPPGEIIWSTWTTTPEMISVLQSKEGLTPQQMDVP